MKSLLLSVRPVAALLLLFLSVLFFAVPEGVDPVVVFGCLSVFYFYFFECVRRPVVIWNGIATYFKIDAMFLLFYYVLFFLPYQKYVLGLSDLVFNKYIDELFLEYSNPSLILSAIGVVAFCEGFRAFSISRRCSVKKFPDDSKAYRSVVKWVALLCTLLVLVPFVIVGLPIMLVGSYSGSVAGDPLVDSLYFLVSHFVMLGIACVVFDYSRSRRIEALDLVLLAISFSWGLILLLMGDRNVFFSIAVVGAGGYFTYVKKIGRIRIILALFAALTLYQVVEVSRKAEDRSIDAIVEAFMESDEQGDGIEEGSFGITTATSRAAIYLVPDKFDYAFGYYKLIGLAGVIPFSRSFLVDDKAPFSTSAELLSYGVLGKDPNWSVGSNIVSDIYVDLGVPGVVVLMLLLGAWAGYVQARARESGGSLKWSSLYLVCLGLYMELPRYAFDFHVRNIVWLLALFYMVDIVMKGARRRFDHRGVA
ncbi:MAG: oligosaccharide repeat unit polymerase [Proteobacteria bacterium]|nr:oligosaccharide repeat unit polymerase [Pseudomonadota bacterium]